MNRHIETRQRFPSRFVHLLDQDCNANRRCPGVRNDPQQSFLAGPRRQKVVHDQDPVIGVNVRFGHIKHAVRADRVAGVCSLKGIRHNQAPLLSSIYYRNLQLRRHGHRDDQARSRHGENLGGLGFQKVLRQFNSTFAHEVYVDHGVHEFGHVDDIIGQHATILQYPIAQFDSCPAVPYERFVCLALEPLLVFKIKGRFQDV
mmetsp:Transcript_9417/g.14163  ORF Transcript_9417/g.14163 Transcript_9417/m.14163 type:complete len:202 (+) Transcript_9417:557-1162(+)